MRKYLFNLGLISAVLGVVGVIRQTQHGPRDWRLLLGWLTWGIGVAIAVGTVIEQAKEHEDEKW